MKTADNTWTKQGKTGPQAKHVVAMLNDSELGPRFLKAAGLDDLARQHEIMTLNRRIDALKADEQRHEREANVIRQDLEMGRGRRPVASRQAQRSDGALAKDRGVVPRSTD